MCEHLIELECYIKSKNIKETFRGKAWSENCREWVYFDCVLSVNKLKEKFNFDNCVKVHEYNDVKIANELGFYCDVCKDGIMGFNPNNENTVNKKHIE
jgi:hypothetical protein